MSTYYTFYSEVEINGKWVLLNPRFMGEQTHTYWNGSRFYFEDTCNALRNGSGRYITNVSDISDELADHIRIWDYSTPSISENGELHSDCRLLTIPVEEMQRIAEKDNKKRAYVPVDELQQFQNNETDGIYEHITVSEYKELDRELQSHYVWFEWEDESSPSKYCRHILKRHNMLLKMSTDVLDHDEKVGDSRLILSID